MDSVAGENPSYAAFCTNCGTSLSAAQNDEKNKENWRFREITDAADGSESQSSEQSAEERKPDQQDNRASVGQDAAPSPFADDAVVEDPLGAADNADADDGDGDGDKKTAQVNMGFDRLPH